MIYYSIIGVIWCQKIQCLNSNRINPWLRADILYDGCVRHCTLTLTTPGSKTRVSRLALRYAILAGETGTASSYVWPSARSALPTSASLAIVLTNSANS